MKFLIWCARAFIGDDPFAILLPDDLVLSLELPQVELAKSGVSHYDRLRPAIEAARALVARARSQRCQTEP